MVGDGDLKWDGDANVSLRFILDMYLISGGGGAKSSAGINRGGGEGTRRPPSGGNLSSGEYNGSGGKNSIEWLVIGEGGSGTNSVDVGYGSKSGDIGIWYIGGMLRVSPLTKNNKLCIKYLQIFLKFWKYIKY